MSDVGGFSTPPVTGGQVIHESREGHNDRNSSEEDERERPEKQPDPDSNQTLDEWSEDKTMVSLRAIEARLFDEVDNLIHHYSDEIQTENDDSTEEAVLSPAYAAYQKQAEASTSFQKSNRTFPETTLSSLTPEQQKRFQELKTDYHYLISLTKNGVEEIPYAGDKDFLEALVEYRNMLTSEYPD